MVWPVGHQTFSDKLSSYVVHFVVYDLHRKLLGSHCYCNAGLYFTHQHLKLLHETGLSQLFLK